MEQAQPAVYFFGKLNQSRDFIASADIEQQDRHFWEGWFSRCGGQSRLIPFTRKTNTAPRIWLFCIRQPEMNYTGLAALSADQTGRRYPFVLFRKHGALEIDLLQRLQEMNAYSDVFQTILNEGKSAKNKHLAPSDTQAEQLDFPPNLTQRLQSYSTGAHSVWYALSDRHYLESEGIPSCALFNKLFGF